MNWKKLMLGDLEHTFTSRDGKEKTSIEFERRRIASTVSARWYFLVSSLVYYKIKSPLGRKGGKAWKKLNTVY
ncbi:hypothetical protein [Streptococcus agalactiae]|uniref:Uncharacterized protein n=1 Tax=Streptococcus agalactiae TaxID=1311 RepID=A0A7Z7P6E9_STRAG|nr:hypothetical protein [Streptococcus agalactiae]SQA20334.1 Uncharacterised protein [Streptococcus agalactiae]